MWVHLLRDLKINLITEFKVKLGENTEVFFKSCMNGDSNKLEMAEFNGKSGYSGKILIEGNRLIAILNSAIQFKEDVA